MTDFGVFCSSSDTYIRFGKLCSLMIVITITISLDLLWILLTHVIIYFVNNTHEVSDSKIHIQWTTTYRGRWSYLFFPVLYNVYHPINGYKYVVSAFSSCRRPKILEFLRRRKKEITIFRHSFWSVSFFSPPIHPRRAGVGSPCIISWNIIDSGFPLYPHWVTKQRVCPPCFNPPFMLPHPPNAHTQAYIYIYILYTDPVLLTIAMTVPSWQFSPLFLLPTHAKQKNIYHAKKKGCWTARLKSQVQYPELMKW